MKMIKVPKRLHTTVNAIRLPQRGADLLSGHISLMPQQKRFDGRIQQQQWMSRPDEGAIKYILIEFT